MKIRDLFSLTAEEVPDYESAVRVLLENQDIDTTKRNVLIAHQFVTASGTFPVQSESESAVGGLGAVDYTVFDAFDYVALGHIHGAQAIGRESVRYAGAPLCCHFSETEQKKGALTVTLGEKGTEPEITLYELPPLHIMRRISGKFNDILEQERLLDRRDEYISVTLTDSDTVFDAAERLRTFFEGCGSRLLDISFRPEDVFSGENESFSGELKEKTVTELFADFFASRCGRSMDNAERELIESVSQRIVSGEDVSTDELADYLVRLAMEQEDGK